MPPGGLVACRSTGQLPRSPAGRGPTRRPWRVRRTAWPWRWSSSAARAHVVVVSVLIPGRDAGCCVALAGSRPHLAAVAGIVHQEDLWQRCRDELTGVDVRTMERFRNLQSGTVSRCKKSITTCSRRVLEGSADMPEPGGFLGRLLSSYLARIRAISPVGGGEASITSGRSGRVPLT